MLLESWDVTPAAVPGHSSGEVAAAYDARLVSLEQPLLSYISRGQTDARLARQRSQSQSQKGGMLALRAGFEEAESRSSGKTLRVYADWRGGRLLPQSNHAFLRRGISFFISSDAYRSISVFSVTGSVAEPATTGVSFTGSRTLFGRSGSRIQFRLCLRHRNRAVSAGKRLPYVMFKLVFMLL